MGSDVNLDESNFLLTAPGTVLRPLRQADAAFVVRLFNEPAFLENVGDRGIRDEGDALAYLEGGPLRDYRERGFGMLAVQLDDAATPGPVGICGLVDRDTLEHPDLGFAFLPEAWGRGLATATSVAVLEDAARRLRLPTVLAITSEGNLASQRVLEKLGFRAEGPTRLGKGREASEVLALPARPHLALTETPGSNPRRLDPRPRVASRAPRAVRVPGDHVRGRGEAR